MSKRAKIFQARGWEVVGSLRLEVSEWPYYLLRVVWPLQPGAALEGAPATRVTTEQHSGQYSHPTPHKNILEL